MSVALERAATEKIGENDENPTRRQPGHLFPDHGGVVSNIQAREHGNRAPSAMACRSLDSINRNTEYWEELLKKSMKGSTSAEGV
jgi:hypothetical protein